MRKLLLATILGGAVTILALAAPAEALTTTPNADGAMLIPAYNVSKAQLIPVYYYRRHHHWHHRRHYHHYRR